MYKFKDIQFNDVKDNLMDLRKSNYEKKADGSVLLSYEFEYKGIIEFYFETGMEGYASIVHDDRGNTKVNGKTLRTLKWAVFLNGGEYIKIYKEDDIVFQGVLLKDIPLMMEKEYLFHFLPKNIEFKEWVKYCNKEYRVELYTNEDIEKRGYK